MNLLDWVSRVESTELRQLFVATKLYAGHTSGLEEGDVILSLNNELITRASSVFTPDLPSTLEAVVVRNLNVIPLNINTFSTENIETSEILVFCGAVLQRPTLAIRQMASRLHSEIYIAGYQTGSVVQRYDVISEAFITHVNGVSTPDLEKFMKEVRTIEDEEYFRITGMTTQNIQFVKTLKRDDYYFPMVYYKRDSKAGRGWKEHVECHSDQVG